MKDLFAGDALEPLYNVACDFGLEFDCDLRPSSPGTLLELAEGDADDLIDACVGAPVEFARPSM